MHIETFASLISVAGSFLATLSGILINTKLTNYRIEQLEKKQDKHNSVIERVYKLEERTSVQDEEIKHLKELSK